MESDELSLDQLIKSFNYFHIYDKNRVNNINWIAENLYLLFTFDTPVIFFKKIPKKITYLGLEFTIHNEDTPRYIYSELFGSQTLLRSISGMINKYFGYLGINGNRYFDPKMYNRMRRDLILYYNCYEKPEYNKFNHLKFDYIDDAYNFLGSVPPDLRKEGQTFVEYLKDISKKSTISRSRKSSKGSTWKSVRSKTSRKKNTIMLSMKSMKGRLNNWTRKRKN